MVGNLITSQHYLDDDTIAAKIAAADYTIQVSPEFAFCGETVRVLLDGHHSLAAAIRSGVEPEVIVQTAQDNDRIGLLDAGDIEGFLDACWQDGEYRYAVTGKDVW